MEDKFKMINKYDEEIEGCCEKCDEKLIYKSGEIFKKCSNGHENHRNNAIWRKKELETYREKSNKEEENPNESKENLKKFNTFLNRLNKLNDEINEFYESKGIEFFEEKKQLKNLLNELHDRILYEKDVDREKINNIEDIFKDIQTMRYILFSSNTYKEFKFFISVNLDVNKSKFKFFDNILEDLKIR